jgi:hypothetical protein
MAQEIDRNRLREWVLSRIESDAAGYRRGESSSVYYGRVDVLLMLGLDFGFWDHHTMQQMAKWVKEQPRNKSLREIAGDG